MDGTFASARELFPTDATTWFDNPPALSPYDRLTACTAAVERATLLRQSALRAVVRDAARRTAPDFIQPSVLLAIEPEGCLPPRSSIDWDTPPGSRCVARVLAATDGPSRDMLAAAWSRPGYAALAAVFPCVAPGVPAGRSLATPLWQSAVCVTADGRHVTATARHGDTGPGVLELAPVFPVGPLHDLCAALSVPSPASRFDVAQLLVSLVALSLPVSLAMRDLSADPLRSLAGSLSAAFPTGPGAPGEDWFSFRSARALLALPSEAVVPGLAALFGVQPLAGLAPDVAVFDVFVRAGRQALRAARTQLPDPLGRWVDDVIAARMDLVARARHQLCHPSMTTSTGPAKRDAR